MAKDRNHNESGVTPRVYKSSDVHKRRVGGKARPSASPRGDVRDEAPSEQAEAQPGQVPPCNEQTLAGPSPAVPSEGLAGNAGETRDAAASADVTQAIETGEPDEAAQVIQATQAAQATQAIEAVDPTQAEESAETDETGEAGETPEADTGDEAGEDDVDPLGEEGLGRRRHLALRVIGIVFGIAAAVCLVLLGMFIVQRWFLNDDKASMLGEWRVADSNATVVISEDTIELNDETAYTYEIDSTAKTMTYRFANLEGHGRYWFSDDRETLIFTDGDDFTTWSTAVDDLAWVIRSVGDDTLPAGEGSIVLRKQRA